MVVVFDVPMEEELVSMRIPHPPGRGEPEREDKTDVYMSPKRFQEEINKRILKHTGESSGRLERDPPPTAEPRVERSPERIRLTQSAPNKGQTNRLLINRSSPRRQNEALLIKQQSAKLFARDSSGANGDPRPKPIYFNLPATEEITSSNEFPMPVIDAKRNSSYILRKSEPIYALQRKYKNKMKQSDSSTDSGESYTDGDEKPAFIKRGVEISKCDALGLNSNELSRFERPSRGDVNLVPRPVERFPYKPLRASSFVVARRRRNMEEKEAMKRSISQHDLRLPTGSSTSDLSVKSFERMAKDALGDKNIEGIPGVQSLGKLRSSLKTPSSVLALKKTEFETAVPCNSCKTSEANFDVASRAARSAKGSRSSATCDIPLDELDDVIDDPCTYAPRLDTRSGSANTTQKDSGVKSGRSVKSNTSEVHGKSTMISTSEGVDQCVVVQRHNKPKQTLLQPRFHTPGKNSKEDTVKNVKARNITPSQIAGFANGFKSHIQGTFDPAVKPVGDGSYSTLVFRPRRQPALGLGSPDSIKPSTSIVFRSQYENKSRSKNSTESLSKVPKLELSNFQENVDIFTMGKKPKYAASVEKANVNSTDDNIEDLLFGSIDHGTVSSDVIHPNDTFHNDKEAEEIMTQADQYLSYQHSKFNRNRRNLNKGDVEVKV